MPVHGHGAEMCGRLLVGLGDETSDPICWQPRGHDGLCLPACGYCDGTGAVCEGDEGRATHYAHCPKCHGSGLGTRS